MSSLSFRDVGGKKVGKKAEIFYHAYLMGWLLHASFTGCDLKSNREAGLGLYDTVIEHKNGRNAAILEFKVKDKKSLTERAIEGLVQIQTRKYRTVISDEIDQLSEVGIAFQGKTAAVVGRTYKRENGNWVKTGEFGKLDSVPEYDQCDHESECDDSDEDDVWSDNSVEENDEGDDEGDDDYVENNDDMEEDD
jgi:hypothetical protein